MGTFMSETVAAPLVGETSPVAKVVMVGEAAPMARVVMTIASPTTSREAESAATTQPSYSLSAATILLLAARAVGLVAVVPAAVGDDSPVNGPAAISTVAVGDDCPVNGSPAGGTAVISDMKVPSNGHLTTVVFQKR